MRAAFPLGGPPRSRAFAREPSAGGLDRLAGRPGGHQHGVVDARERRRIPQVEQLDLADREPRPHARGRHVDALGGALDAHDLAAEQPPAARLADELDPDRPGAREVAGARAVADRGGHHGEACVGGLALAQACAGHLVAADARHRRADDAGEGEVGAGGVGPGDAALLVRVRAELHVDRPAQRWWSSTRRAPLSPASSPAARARSVAGLTPVAMITWSARIVPPPARTAHGAPARPVSTSSTAVPTSTRMPTPSAASWTWAAMSASSGAKTCGAASTSVTRRPRWTSASAISR